MARELEAVGRERERETDRIGEPEKPVTDFP